MKKKLEKIKQNKLNKLNKDSSSHSTLIKDKLPNLNNNSFNNKTVNDISYEHLQSFIMNINNSMSHKN